MKMKLDAQLNRYTEQFDDNFPIFAVRGMDEDEIIKIVQKCLDENKPFITDCPDGVDY